MRKIEIADERARKIYEMWVEYAEENEKWKLKSKELIELIWKKLGKDFLSRQTIYKKLNYLLQLGLIKRKEKGRKEVYYELKNNPYTQFRKECLKIERMAKNYFRIIEEKYNRKEISKEEAIKYASDGTLFISYIELKLLSQPVNEYSMLIYDYASKFMNRLGNTFSSYSLWNEAMDMHMKELKERIKEKEPKDEEIRKYSPVNLLNEMIYGKKMKPEEIKKAIKVKMSAKIGKKV